MEPHFQFYRSQRIKYYTCGKGETLVLLHGYQADSRIWKLLIPLLQDHYTLLIPDLPGHGESPLIQSTNSMDFLAEMVFNLIMASGSRGVTLAGHSMGGYVALCFAEKYPTFTDRLVLLNSHPFEDSMTTILARNRESEIIQSGKKEILLRSFVQNNFCPKNLLSLKNEIELATHIALGQPENGMLADLAGMMARTNKVSVLLKKRINAAFILGRDDKRIALNQFDSLDINALNIHWINDCGHMSMLEKPAEVARLILENKL